MYINDFVNMTSRAWVIPILSKLNDGVPGRQAALINATGANRAALVKSIEHLIELGLLERNPGHGHPLRPEFRLTEEGIIMAKIAQKIEGAVEKDHNELVRRSWTLPVLSLLHKPSYFIDFKMKLNTITDRALSQSLKTLEDHNWVERNVISTQRPPRPIYSAVNAGRIINHIIYPEINFV